MYKSYSFLKVRMITSDFITITQNDKLVIYKKVKMINISNNLSKNNDI